MVDYGLVSSGSLQGSVVGACVDSNVRLVSIQFWEFDDRATVLLKRTHIHELIA